MGGEEIQVNRAPSAGEIERMTQWPTWVRAPPPRCGRARVLLPAPSAPRSARPLHIVSTRAVACDARD